MSLLVAIDLGATDHPWLVTRAGRLASVIGGRVDLVNVTQGVDAKANVLQQLNALMNRIPKGARGVPRVMGGDLIDLLVSESQAYDVLVVGPREPGALSATLFGTVATRVIRRTRCAVFVARGEQLVADRAPRLLCGVDLTGGDPTWVTIEADKWALRFGGKVDLVFAVPEGADDAHHPLWTEDLLQLLQTIGEPSRGQGFLARGTPEDCLNALSDRYDVVLVGNREVGLSERVVGSIAHHVVRGADCDVLVLPSATQA